MELFEKEGYYIIKNGEYSLWCSRIDGSMEPKKGECDDNLVHAFSRRYAFPGARSSKLLKKILGKS